MELESIKLDDSSAAVGVQDQERQDAIRIQLRVKKKEEIDALKQRLYGLTLRRIAELEVRLRFLRAAESPDAKAIAKRQSELESLMAVSHDELRDIKTRSSLELELEFAMAELRRAQVVHDKLTDRLQEMKATAERQRRLENILEKERDLRQKEGEQLREQVRELAQKAGIEIRDLEVD